MNVGTKFQRIRLLVAGRVQANLRALVRKKSVKIAKRHLRACPKCRQQRALIGAVCPGCSTTLFRPEATYHLFLFSMWVISTRNYFLSTSNSCFHAPPFPFRRHIHFAPLRRVPGQNLSSCLFMRSLKPQKNHFLPSGVPSAGRFRKASLTIRAL